MRPLSLQFWTSFTLPNGDVRELKNPEGPATPRQLRRLNEAGALVVVEPGTTTPIRTGEAAYAVSLVKEAAPPAGEASKAWRFL